MPSDKATLRARSRRRLLIDGGRWAAGLALATPAFRRAGAGAGDEAGVVHRLEGSARAVLGRLTRPVRTGSVILVGERIETGPQARLELRMREGTTLTLGAESDLVITAIAPSEDGGPAVLRLLRGVFLATTAAIAGRRWNALTVITDGAVLGVRGTTVWAERSAEGLAVLMVDGSRVHVETPAGAVDLIEPLAGTDVRPSAAPTPAKRWGDARVAASLAKVTFP